jgi:hypothetical protein
MEKTKRVRTGGRKKGTPNKRTKKIFDMVKDKGDPVAFMLDAMNNEELDFSARMDAAKAVAPYTNRKQPTAIEADNKHSFPDKIDVEFTKPTILPFTGTDENTD